MNFNAFFLLLFMSHGGFNIQKWESILSNKVNRGQVWSFLGSFKSDSIYIEHLRKVLILAE